MCDYMNMPFSLRNAQQITEFFSQPGRWTAMGSLAIQDFPLEAGQYLMLGDNSPSSSDSRFWGENDYHVSRELLIGKAFFVYWPHAWETNPHFTLSLRTREIGVPFYPNFRDMRLIR
jgi:signal peptidase I